MLLWLLKGERCCGWCPMRGDQSGGHTAFRWLLLRGQSAEGWGLGPWQFSRALRGRHDASCSTEEQTEAP